MSRTVGAPLPELLIIGLAFALRLHGLTSQSLWRDEVDALRFATQPLGDLLSMFVRPGENGPLYFLALRPWLRAAGDSEFALRFPAALFGTLAVPVTWLLARRLCGRRAALGSALLMATAPYLVWYGQEAKMYALLTFLVPLSLWLTTEVSRRGGSWRWALLYAATGAMFYVHLLAALAVAVQVAWLALLPYRPLGWRGRAIGGYLAALTLPYLPLALWQGRLLVTRTFTSGFTWVPLGHILAVLAVGFSRGILPVSEPLTLLPYLLALVAGVAAGIGSGQLGQAAAGLGPRRAAALLLSWLLLPPLGVYAISTLVVPVYTDRYLIWAMPAFLVLLSLGAAVLHRAWRPLGVLTLAAMLALNVSAVWVQAQVPIKADFRSAARFVAGHYRPGDMLIFQIPYVRFNFAYYGDKLNPAIIAGRWMDGPDTNNGMSPAQVDDLLAAGTRAAPAAWLIASEVPMWDARGLTQAWLDAHGVVTDHADFVRVSVTRYEFRRGASP